MSVDPRLPPSAIEDYRSAVRTGIPVLATQARQHATSCTWLSLAKMRSRQFPRASRSTRCGRRPEPWPSVIALISRYSMSPIRSARMLLSKSQEQRREATPLRHRLLCAAKMERVSQVLQFPVIVEGRRPFSREMQLLEKLDFQRGRIAP